VVGLLLLTAAATAWTRSTVSSAEATLSDRVLPARQAAADLTTAYVDQETGQRGFLLTGDTRFLEPYDAGRADAARLAGKLDSLLSGDPGGLGALSAVLNAAARWQAGAAQPEIAARIEGPIPADQLLTMGLTGKTLFDALRGRLDDLARRTGALARDQLRSIDRAQSFANRVTGVSVVVALAVTLTSVSVLRRRLSRPMDRLVAQVQRIAAGDRGGPIDRTGPRELALVADAVERMRTSMLQHSAERLATQRELTLREEHERVATDLHDLTIQRVFALGLALTSLSRRQPDLAPQLTPLIEETDRITREIRTVVFDLRPVPESEDTLRGRVVELTEQSARALGFIPVLEFAGPVDGLGSEQVADDLVGVLREALSNVVRHAGATHVAVRLSAAASTLVLTVRDDGRGLATDAPRRHGLSHLVDRASRHGGTADVRSGPDGGTVLEWRVPLPQPVAVERCQAPDGGRGTRDLVGLAQRRSSSAARASSSPAGTGSENQ